MMDDITYWPLFDKAAFDHPLLAVSELTEPMLPSGWAEWVFETARVNNTPRDYVALSLIVTAAGTIGNTTRGGDVSVVRADRPLGR